MSDSKKARRRRERGAPLPTQAPSRGSSAGRWCGLAIVLAGAATYWNSLSIPFVLDDLGSIVDNRQIREWWHLGAVLSPQDNLAVAGRPLVNLSLALNYALGGLDVRGYHALNLAFHLACALLLFGIVRRTFEAHAPGRADDSWGPALPAVAVALIWTVHPLNSEAIDYVVQRTESMMALFYLLTLYASVRAHRSPRPLPWQVAAVAACALGMACKESMATAPLVLVLYDWVFEYGSPAQAVGARWRFYAAAAATWTVVLALAGRGPRAEVVGLSSGVAPWTYLLNQAEVVSRYLWLAVWPRSLVAFYGWPLPLRLADAAPYVMLMLALIGLTLLALFRKPVVGFLGAWFFITLAPASSVIPVATEVGAERRMYLPLMALAVLAVLAARQLWSARIGRAAPRATLAPSRAAAWLAIGLVAGPLAARTVARNREYASGLSLARTIVERRPTSIAHQILAEELMAAGRHDEAVAELREAAPGDSKARYPLGLELFAQGKWQDAIVELQAFADTWQLPYRLVPHWLEPSREQVLNARNTMAQAFARLGRWPEAAEQARRALTLGPSNAEALGLLADALFAGGQYSDAAAYYERYAKLRPREARALMRLGTALMAANRPAEALAAFRQAVDADPRDGLARRDLANALFDTRNIDEAATHAREAVALLPNDAAAHDLLGRTLAVQGRVADAVAEFTRALQLDPNNADARQDLARVSRFR